MINKLKLNRYSEYYLILKYFLCFYLLFTSLLISKTFSVEGNFLNKKCPNLSIKKFTYIIFDKIDKSNFIKIDQIDCGLLQSIDDLNTKKVNITTSRREGKMVSCISDTKQNPCKFIIGEFRKNIIPTIALKKIFDYQAPKPLFLNETTERLFINPYDIFKNRYKNIDSSFIRLDKYFKY